jgi:hypothetical protein
MKKMFSIPGRDYELVVNTDFHVKGNRSSFLDDIEKIRDGLIAAFDKALAEASTEREAAHG